MPKVIEKKVDDALYGIQISSEGVSISDPRVFECSSPPGYMIKMVLQHLYQNSLPIGGDKSEWALSVQYKKKIFTIEDFKRFKWNIYGKEKDRKVAEELAKKLISAAKIFNHKIKERGETSFKNDDFALQNNYYKAVNIYEFFAEQVKTILKKKSKLGLKGKPSLVDLLSAETERRRLLENYTIATSIFFFSLTETLFDSIFSLSDRKGLKYSEFRKKDWEERFKLLIPLDGNIKELYEELIVIRKYYRNIPVHSSPEYFFNYLGFGLIPSSFDALYNPHMIPTLGFSVEEAERIINCYERLLLALENHPSSKYGFLYAIYALPIFISQKQVEELKKHMTSLSEFKKELEIRSNYQDAHDNMEILV